ncbi:MAG: DUF4367 domain-containing protein [Dethiobacteria bacterium]|jgi:hypothetical protein
MSIMNRNDGGNNGNEFMQHEEMNSREIDELIKEAISAEIDKITPPPPERVWAKIAAELQGETADAEKLREKEKAKFIASWRNRQWAKFVLVAAAFFLVFGLYSLLPRGPNGQQFSSGRVAEESGSANADSALWLPGVMSESKEEAESLPAEDSILAEFHDMDEGRRTDTGILEGEIASIDADALAVFSLLPWIETADYKLFPLDEAQRLIDFDLPHPRYLPDGFILEGVFLDGYVRDESKDEAYLLFSDAYGKKLIIGRIETPGTAGDLLLEKLQECEGIPEQRELGAGIDALLLRFNEESSVLAWEEEDFLYTVLGTTTIEELLKISQSLRN